jgi:hypothetical protein
LQCTVIAVQCNFGSLQEEIGVKCKLEVFGSTYSTYSPCFIVLDSRRYTLIHTYLFTPWLYTPLKNLCFLYNICPFFSVCLHICT